MLCGAVTYGSYPFGLCSSSAICIQDLFGRQKLSPYFKAYINSMVCQPLLSYQNSAVLYLYVIILPGVLANGHFQMPRPRVNNMVAKTAGRKIDLNHCMDFACNEFAASKPDLRERRTRTNAIKSICRQSIDSFELIHKWRMCTGPRVHHKQWIGLYTSMSVCCV